MTSSAHPGLHKIRKSSEPPQMITVVLTFVLCICMGHAWTRSTLSASLSSSYPQHKFPAERHPGLLQWYVSYHRRRLPETNHTATLQLKPTSSDFGVVRSLQLMWKQLTNRLWDSIAMYDWCPVITNHTRTNDCAICINVTSPTSPTAVSKDLMWAYHRASI